MSIGATYETEYGAEPFRCRSRVLHFVDAHETRDGSVSHDTEPSPILLINY